MIKRTITETTEIYDKDGNIVEKTIRVEEETDDETRVYQPSYHPWTTPSWIPPSGDEPVYKPTRKTE